MLRRLSVHHSPRQGIADLMVVAESGFTFRGDAKPRLFQRNRQRFQAPSRDGSVGFAEMIGYQLLQSDLFGVSK